MNRYAAIAIVFVFAVMLGTPVLASSAEQSLRDRLAYSRAVESIIWSLPLMSYKAMRDGHKVDGGVGYNVVAYNSKVQDWRLQITTPNNTTPYVLAFWDVSQGPVVIEIPATEEGVGLFGVIMDSWQRPLEDVGAKGKDQGLGGKYLVMPPNYRGSLPVGGYIPLNQKTYTPDQKPQRGRNPTMCQRLTGKDIFSCSASTARNQRYLTKAGNSMTLS